MQLVGSITVMFCTNEASAHVLALKIALMSCPVELQPARLHIPVLSKEHVAVFIAYRAVPTYNASVRASFVSQIAFVA